MYEHQHNISTLKADSELALKLTADDAAKREDEGYRDRRALKTEIRSQVGLGLEWLGGLSR